MAQEHDLEEVCTIPRVSGVEYRCRACLRRWAKKPVHYCPGLPDYPYWDSVPDHFKTETQLGKLGLRPGPDVKTPSLRALCSYTAHREDKVYKLYDLGEAVPKRKPSLAQLAALEKANAALLERLVERKRFE